MDQPVVDTWSPVRDVLDVVRVLVCSGLVGQEQEGVDLPAPRAGLVEDEARAEVVERVEARSGLERAAARELGAQVRDEGAVQVGVVVGRLPPGVGSEVGAERALVVQVTQVVAVLPPHEVVVAGGRVHVVGGRHERVLDGRDAEPRVHAQRPGASPRDAREDGLVRCELGLQDGRVGSEVGEVPAAYG
ncbi:hypothetical protein [Actinotalea subterranea]|uniref:hypothetical protein n=1 Tax=Actinotalea subterranea TaxID=2607497 RepID=UPI0011EECCC7|nr:hypothetical protein [Actinotalea subterranea]